MLKNIFLLFTALIMIG